MLGDECYKYPRGRVIYDANKNKHIIYADKCILQSVLEVIAFLLDIQEYDLREDEHYVCSKCENKRR